MKMPFSPLGFLSEEGLDQIEETAFRILEEIGISLDHARAREMLQMRGCRVEQERVFIPRDAARWAVENVTPYTKMRFVDGSPE